MSRRESADSIRSRLENLDWQEIEKGLWELGYAKTPVVLTLEECNELVALYAQDSLFRTTIQMERYKFGVGEYRYAVCDRWLQLASSGTLRRYIFSSSPWISRSRYSRLP